MSNVIDIRSRLKTQNNEPVNGADFDIGKIFEKMTGITDIGKIRAEKINEDRRQVKRTILSEFISVHVVIPNQGVLKVALYDINRNGVAFDLEERFGRFNLGEDVELRIYLNQKTYFKFGVKVAHIYPVNFEGTVRHGAEFIRDSINSEALDHFVGFLESVITHLRHDGGDTLVSKINS